MEANCLIFPSPRNYNLQFIKNRVVLIPQESDNNVHTPYQSQYSTHSIHEADEFSYWLSSRSGKDTSSSKHDRKLTNDNSMQGILDMKQKVSCSDSIPCLFIPGIRDKLIVFFHANGEDITSAFQFLRMVNFQTGYPVLAMEYRGYSIYQGQTNPVNIENDSKRVIEFLQANKVAADQLIIFGRSIGCAVALAVTQQYRVYCAILLSPFISLKKVATDLYGGCAGLMLKEAFNNEENLKSINCPVLIIHGDKDSLVPYEHSLALLAGCQSYCRLKIIQNMTHTKFNFRNDFIRHFKQFIADIE